MAFYRPDYVKVKNAFTSKKEEAKAASEERRKVLCAEIPELASVCRRLAATGPRIFEAALNPEGDLEGKIAAIRAENEELLAEQKRILAEHGYPEDWFDVKYECPICNDEGNVNGVMCECMKKKLIEAGYETAGIAGLAESDGTLHRLATLVEKPSPENAPSRLAIASRYVFTPDIFAELEHTPRGKGGEIQLTDAMKSLLAKRPMYGLQFDGRRYDIGNKLEFLKSTVEFGLRRQEFRDAFAAYLREIVKDRRNV